MTKDKIEVKFSSGKAYESKNKASQGVVDFQNLKSTNTEEDKAVKSPQGRAQSMFTMEAIKPAQSKINSQHEGYVRMKVNTDFINQYAEQYLRIVEKNIHVHKNHDDPHTSMVI